VVVADSRRHEPINQLSSWPTAASRPQNAVLFGHTVVVADSQRRAA
jgi:hypothetical protein